MAEKYYRLPGANSIIKLSSICNVSYVEPLNIDETIFGFYVEYDQKSDRTYIFEGLGRETFQKIHGDTPYEWNSLTQEFVIGNGKETTERYRADLIENMTRDNILIDNFPNE